MLTLHTATDSREIPAIYARIYITKKCHMKCTNTCDKLLIIRVCEKVKFGFIFTARGAHASLRNQVSQLSRPSFFLLLFCFFNGGWHPAYWCITAPFCFFFFLFLLFSFSSLPSPLSLRRLASNLLHSLLFQSVDQRLYIYIYIKKLKYY